MNRISFRNFIFLFWLLLSSFRLSAQQECNLHIVTIPGNLVSPFKFNFDINGNSYKLKAGHCLDINLKAEIINISMIDSRWVKNETINVNVPSELNLYVLIKLAKNKEIMKGEFYMAEVICKECFDELRKRCKR